MSALLLVSAEFSDSDKKLEKRGLVHFANQGNGELSDHDRRHDYFAKSITLDSGFVPSLGLSYDNFGKNIGQNYYEGNVILGSYSQNSGLYDGKGIPENSIHGEIVPQAYAKPVQYKIVQTTTAPLSLPYREPVVRYTQTPTFKPSRISFPDNKEPGLDQPIILSSLGHKEKLRGGQTYSVSGSYTFGPNKGHNYRKGIVNSVPVGHRVQSSIKQSSYVNTPLKLKRKGGQATQYRFEVPQKTTNSRSSMYIAHKSPYNTFSKKY